MKSTLLKTLAATSLVATTHGAINVTGVSFKERGVNAPAGTIISNPGTVGTTRGYLILDSTVSTATPNKATYIEYGAIRDGGDVTKYYTIDTDFTEFRADLISGETGGLRLYGHMLAPVLVAATPNPQIPFSGTALGTNFPNRLSFDQTAFQTGGSDALAGPRVLTAGSSTLRSVVSGSGAPVAVRADTLAGVQAELIARLKLQNYVRIAGEAPEITTDLPLTDTIQDGVSKTYTVALDPDVFPGSGDTFAAPTFQWYKNNVAIAGATTASLVITGAQATTGAGSYKVVVTNAVGSDTSNTLVVTPVVTAFLADIPATLTLNGANSFTFVPTLNPTPVTPPTFQWFKATAAAGPFNPVASPPTSNVRRLTVIPGETNTGAGFYRLDVTTSAGTISSTVCNVTTAVAGTTFCFTTNLPRTNSVAFSGTLVLSPVVNAAANPAVASRQWSKAAPGSTTFVDIPAGSGGTSATFTVNGNDAAANGPGTYRMIATSAAPVQTITTVECVITTAP
ncbi:hypothetical protein [Luteolibacter soli]|uniref:Ig-like domain-containing protein n=1 Tax=Luteolibacter soli TaxID=3135280 RepID=A0ABU9AZ18_9BACT